MSRCAIRVFLVFSQPLTHPPTNHLDHHVKTTSSEVSSTGQAVVVQPPQSSEGLKEPLTATSSGKPKKILGYNSWNSLGTIKNEQSRPIGSMSTQEIITPGGHHVLANWRSSSIRSMLITAQLPWGAALRIRTAKDEQERVKNRSQAINFLAEQKRIL